MSLILFAECDIAQCTPLLVMLSTLRAMAAMAPNMQVV